MPYFLVERTITWSCVVVAPCDESACAIAVAAGRFQVDDSDWWVTSGPLTLDEFEPWELVNPPSGGQA